MKFKYYYIFVFVLFFGQLSIAQSVKFTADTSYIREMGDFLQKSRKPEVAEIFVRFSNLWNSDSLTIRQKSAIISVSNNLIKKRARVFPHFYNYM